MLVTRATKVGAPARKEPMRVRTWVITVAVLAVFTVIAGWWVSRPLTAAQVVEQTAVALANHDVDTLLALTMREERQKLNLKETNVRQFLDDVYYSRPRPTRLVVTGLNCVPIDECISMLTPPTSNESDPPIPIAVTETENGEWHLALGYLLYSISANTNPEGSVFDRAAEMAVRSRKYGIRGTRLNTSGYAIITGM